MNNKNKIYALVVSLSGLLLASQALAKLPKELRAPRISATILFSELSVLNPETDTYKGWRPIGLGPLVKWRFESITDNLGHVGSSGIWIEVPLVNTKPIYFDPELRRQDPGGFFAGIPANEHSLDASYIVYKYMFFPQSILGLHQLASLTDERGKKELLGEPMAFYLVRKTDHALAQDELQAVPNEAASREFVARQLQKYAHYFKAEPLFDEDPVSAEKSLLLSSALSHPLADYVLGCFYFDGAQGARSKIEKDEERGARYLLSSKDPRAWYRLGTACFERDDMEQAKQRFKKAAKKGFPMAHYTLGVPFDGDGEMANARESLQRALEEGYFGDDENAKALFEKYGLKLPID